MSQYEIYPVRQTKMLNSMCDFFMFMYIFEICWKKCVKSENFVVHVYLFGSKFRVRAEHKSCLSLIEKAYRHCIIGTAAVQAGFPTVCRVWLDQKMIFYFYFQRIFAFHWDMRGTRSNQHSLTGFFLHKIKWSTLPNAFCTSSLLRQL